ncbi:phosphate transport system permease protein [Friedmanniella endophytica]|uniref:Phosphate transport system permease protein n=1 Tax=Microlunatus kandeliicorticis TaxID=1759536 RepID=A0A7W3P7J7_9ACTN|nr:phosphate ABC transporter permease subunit PstC [Microlunatus kandeliicorticis]MBA8796201.1 phosphate transport system permease protein [Microlunatus kandeliicorticis]
MTTISSPSARRGRRARQSGGDAVFAGVSLAAGIAILVVLAGVAVFLIVQSVPAFSAAKSDIPGAGSLLGYLAPLAFGTVLSAVLALLFAVPLAVAIALFITHYAPRRLAQALGYLVDLLAAVPSVVFGLWGIFWLAPKLVPLYLWLNDNLGFLPIFGSPSVTGRTILTASLVLAVMILPIVTAICREVFLQAPKLQEEAALALGATRWEMIRMAVLPFGRAGIVSGAMLGLGRALGETLAVALVLSVDPTLITANLIGTTNPSTIAANIALQFPESFGVSVNILILSGLLLFVITFVVNLAARTIVAKSAVKV